MGVLLRCVECGAESDEFARGWRAYRLDDLDVWDEDEPEISMYCPECARREFGAFRWEDIR